MLAKSVTVEWPGCFLLRMFGPIKVVNTCSAAWGSPVLQRVRSVVGSGPHLTGWYVPNAAVGRWSAYDGYAAFAANHRCRLAGNPIDFQLTVVHDRLLTTAKRTSAACRIVANCAQVKTFSSYCRIQQDVVDEVGDSVLCLCCHKYG
jgi:hypothetical protein